MEDENKDSTNVNSTINAVSGLVKAIPVYQDTLQPAAKQIGQTLETVTKAVNIALAPIKAIVWGYEQIENFVSKRVSEKLKNVSEENITTPPPQVAGPAIEALRFSGHDVNLRELYANLLATSMDKATIHLAHPGFVEILKNLTSDEAILLQAFTIQRQYPIIDIMAELKPPKQGYLSLYPNYSHLYKKTNLQRPDLTPTYLNNLCRLGILEMPALTSMTEPNIYEPLENDSDLGAVRKQIDDMSCNVRFERKVISVTSFGQQFIVSVVIEKK